jgi:hypothetical protein
VRKLLASRVRKSCGTAIKQSIPQMGPMSALPPLGQSPAEAMENIAQSDDDIKMNDQESDDTKVEI